VQLDVARVHGLSSARVRLQELTQVVLVQFKRLQAVHLKNRARQAGETHAAEAQRLQTVQHINVLGDEVDGRVPAQI